MPSIDMETGLDALQIIDGRNVGFYAGPFVAEALFSAYAPNPLSSRALLVGTDLSEIVSGKGVYFAPDSRRHVLVGARSLGSVRMYFLEPTTVEVNAATVFSLDTGDTGVARFVPDPTLEHPQIPPLPNGTQPSDGVTVTGGSTLTSASQDFLLSGINLGDKLYVDTHPLLGTVAHAGTTISNLAGTTLVYSIDNGPDRTLVFVRDDPTIPADQVTTPSAVEQINANVGLDIASYDASYRVKFSTELAFVVRASSTCLSALLGAVLNYTPTKLYSDSDTSNEAPHYLDVGYTVTAVGQTTLSVTPAFVSTDAGWATTATEETFRVNRVGVQRVNTTQMSTQVAEAGLYYADFELVSEGTGDFWNINANQQLTATGYKSDGWYLTVPDTNLTFSPEERPQLVLSRTMMEQGTDDDPRNATQLTGQSISISYSRSEIVNSVQDFLGSDTERVVCASPLSRHLIPHFVRFDLEYFGGSTEDIVLADVQKYVREIYPIEGLYASRLQKIAVDRGASKVTNPITMIAIVHHVDRTIYAQRSQNALSTGRLSAFIPDAINVKRNISGSSL